MTAKKKSTRRHPTGHAERRGTQAPAAPTGTASGIRDLPFLGLLALFVGSGGAALIYQVVWFQLLELSIGSSAVSIAVLLATFMGGMSIGSLGLARVVPVERHPLRVYALLELGIGACGLAVLWLLPYAGGLYAAIGGTGFGGVLLRGLVSAICLLPPTILMGATLPAVSRWIEATPRGTARLGYLYGGNTLGSVAGCLIAGFYLLRVFDMSVATYVAVAINLAVGGLALLMARANAYERPEERRTRSSADEPDALWPVLVATGLSGFTSLSAEVVWTRLLSLQLGATVYTYSLILAAILFGLGVGSYLGSWLGRTRLGARTAFGLCQALVIVGVAWAAYQVTVVLPFTPNDAALTRTVAATFRRDLWVSLVAVLPAALAWGASFPLALAAAAPHEKDPGRSVGFVYAANTFGAIFGSLGTSLVLMASIGSRGIQQLLITLAAVSSLLLLVPVGVRGVRAASKSPRTGWLVAVPVALALVLVATVQPVPGALVGYGPGSAAWRDSFGTFVFVGEGMNSSVAISELASGALNYHNAGKVQASSEPGDLRLERMLGHLTTLQPEEPTSVLVIGCGAGVTAGAVSIDPRVERLTVVEIEPLVPKAAQAYFSRHNEGVVANPKTTVVVDDGRHFLMTSDETFDAITCDPFDPWTKGAATLSTREFYESVREHLNPGGTVTVWVPLYQTRAETVRSHIATFTSVFPNAVVWDNVTEAAGDVVLSGRVDDTPLDIDAIEARVALPEYGPVRESLSSVGFGSAQELLATFGARGEALQAWASGAEINTDRNLRLQYLAGEGFVFGLDEAEAIYGDMTARRTWPDEFFTGSPERVRALRSAAGL